MLQKYTFFQKRQSSKKSYGCGILMSVSRSLPLPRAHHVVHRYHLLYKRGIIERNQRLPIRFALRVTPQHIVHHHLAVPLADLVIIFEKVGLNVLRQFIDRGHPPRRRRPLPIPEPPEQPPAA